MLVQILRMAPSAQPRISGQLALTPIPGSGRPELRQSARAEGLVRGSPGGDHTGDRRDVPSVSGRVCDGRQAIGASRPRRQSGEWRLPAIPGFPGKWRWRQFPSPAHLNSGKLLPQKPLRQDQMTAIMPASGRLRPRARLRALVADLQLAPSTHTTLGGIEDGHNERRKYGSLGGHAGKARRAVANHGAHQKSKGWVAPIGTTEHSAADLANSASAAWTNTNTAGTRRTKHPTRPAPDWRGCDRERQRVRPDVSRTGTTTNSWPGQRLLNRSQKARGSRTGNGALSAMSRRSRSPVTSTSARPASADAIIQRSSGSRIGRSEGLRGFGTTSCSRISATMSSMVAAGSLMRRPSALRSSLRTISPVIN